MADSEDVYNHSNTALEALNNVWKQMLEILEAVSAASAKSLTVEPDLTRLQDIRKQYTEQFVKLKSSAEWLDANRSRSEDDMSVTGNASHDQKGLLEEFQELQKESEHVTKKLKALLDQSYSLQFQIDMLLSSSNDTSLPTVAL